MVAAYGLFAEKAGLAPELVVVLDGTGHTSTDSAITYLQLHIGQVVVVKYEKNRGKGYAIRQGVAVAQGDVIIYTDVDFPYTLESTLKVFRKLQNDECDVAVGVKDDAYYAHVPPMRRRISRFLRFMIGAFLSMPITDTQCGLKGFQKKVAPVFLQTTINRYLFDLEFVKSCYNTRQLRVEAVPISLNDDIRFSKMHYRILVVEMFNFLRLLLKRG